MVVNKQRITLVILTVTFLYALTVATYAIPQGPKFNQFPLFYTLLAAITASGPALGYYLIQRRRSGSHKEH